MSTRPIVTPRGKVFIRGGKAVLEWNTNFRPMWVRRYTATQRFVDSEVLRRCEPYTPLLTGMMILTGILATVIGSGVVRWIAPYSRRQYYSKRKPGSKTGPLRGPFWFERMKAVNRESIVAGARAVFFHAGE